MGTVVKLPNITTEAIESLEANESAASRQSNFNPKNYLDVKLAEGQSKKTLTIRLLPMDLETGRSVSVRANRPLEDVLYMPIGSEIIFRRGMKPIFTKRYNIFQNEMYKKITAAYEKHVEKEMSQATR